MIVSRWLLILTTTGFFFFQAEDGIRDVAVTGVQTCALPISAARVGSPQADRSDGLVPVAPHRSARRVRGLASPRCPLPAAVRPPAMARVEIGRASCRERV